LLSRTRHIVLGLIDFSHRIFFAFIPHQTYRYLFCGGFNTLLNIFLYSFAYNVTLHGQDLPLFGNVAITARVAAWIIAFSVSFPLGFIMSRHIVFPESNLHGRVQLFRYALVTITFILMNYFLIKFFAAFFPRLWPTVSYTFINVFIAILSYISQRRFTFKITPEEEAVS
jgi:putative flippase GtrA